MNNNTLDLQSSIAIMAFEKENREAAANILKMEYQIPLGEVMHLIRRIFDEISNCRNWKNFNRQESIWALFHKFARRESKALKLSMGNNFGLTERTFIDLCVQLREGDETIFEIIFLEHFQDCVHFLKRKYNIDHAVAYDVSMDTILQFRQKLILRKINYGNLRFLFTSMAGQIYLKTLRSQKKNKDLTSIFDSENLEEDFMILEKAIQELGDGCRQLLKQNIYDNLELKEIAVMYGKTAAAVRKQKERCINRLKLLFAKQNGISS